MRMSRLWSVPPFKWLHRERRDGYTVTPKSEQVPQAARAPKVTITPSTPAVSAKSRCPAAATDQPHNSRSESAGARSSDSAKMVAGPLAGKTLKRNGASSDVKADEALKGKVVALYFSAHWCPPCRQFTPLLKEYYEEVAEKNPLEIVFVPFDRSEEDLKNYLAESHGEWLYVPFGDATIQELSEKYSVQGIPALIIIKQDGSVAVANGRNDVQSKGPAGFDAWKKACGI